MYLAENRLSSDFCDWSEVTDGLLGDTWKQEVKTALDKKRRLWHLHYFFSRGHTNRPHGLPWWYLRPYTRAALSLQVKHFFLCVFIPPVGAHSDFQKVQTVFVNTRHQIVRSYETAYQQSARNVNNLMFHIGIGAAASLGTKQINNTRPARRFMLKLSAVGNG